MSKFNRLIDTIDKNITNGVQNGILHLVAENDSYDGRSIIRNGQELVSFGSYSYLGLEHHPLLKAGSIEATERYGTQFGYSRAYISIHLYSELESLLSQIFDADVLVAPSTTLAHQAVLPVIVGDNDVVIIDQQVHASVQTTVKMIRDRGVKIELIRHNRIDQIEERILELRSKHDKIWYMPDGVYSMYGDYAPLKELKRLMDKYEQFHLYVDDAHGMSWTGKNGSGYVLSEIALHDQMILVTSLNKAFAAAGGAIVLPNKEWTRKIKTCGGTLIFSTPIQPPMLGVGVASAKLHLSNEIYVLQEELKKRIAYCALRIKELGLPEISSNDSPIFYLPTSLPKVSYNLVRRMISEGYHMCPALFPAVAMRKSGIRFCLSVNHSMKDIDGMLAALAYHYPKALEDESLKLSSVDKAFGLTESTHIIGSDEHKNRDEFSIDIFETIEDVNEEEWNQLLGSNGTFDVDGLRFLEESFSGNLVRENNWDFYYLIIRDKDETPILATFFTKCVCKDDIFKPTEISRQLEDLRKENPYFMTTDSLMMGSLLTEGNHLYVDKSNARWKEAVLLLFNQITELQQKTKTNGIYLRDFDKGDHELQDLCLANGYIEVDVPDYSHEMTNFGWESTDEFMQPLSSKKRQQLRRDSLKFEDKYSVVVKSHVSEAELRDLFNLYKNVKSESYIINTFDLPFKVFREMNGNPKWEMIVLSLKDAEYPNDAPKKPVAVVFAYNSGDVYVPLLVGLDYRYKFSHKNYKQAVWQVVKRANDLGVKKLFFGITATTEKQRVGATPKAKVAYVQVEDSYNMEMLEFAKVGEMTPA